MSKVVIHENARIHSSAIIGSPFRPYQGGIVSEEIVYRDTIVECGAAIGAGCVIGKGTHIGERSVIDSYCQLSPNASIGKDCLLVYRAMVGSDVVIGDACVIGGHVGEGCRVGSRCRVFGRLIHKQLDTVTGWDEYQESEPAPSVADDSFVGVDSILIGGISVGPRSYVCAGAVVTIDVPPRHIAVGVNNVIPAERWRGALSGNPLFRS